MEYLTHYYHTITIRQMSRLVYSHVEDAFIVEEQWSNFEDDIDYVVPIRVRSISSVESISFGLPCVFDQKNLATKQDKDKNLYQLKMWLKSNTQPSQRDLALSSPNIKYVWSCKSQLHLRDNILYYLWEDRINPRFLFVSLMRHCYDNKTTGHVGQTKTYEKLKQCTIQYGMSTDSELYAEKCSICNKIRNQILKPKQDQVIIIQGLLQSAFTLTNQNLFL